MGSIKGPESRNPGLDLRRSRFNWVLGRLDIALSLDKPGIVLGFRKSSTGLSLGGS